MFDRTDSQGFVDRRSITGWRSFIAWPAFNGTNHWELSVPATFVVDRDAVIRFAVAIPSYLRRADPAEVMAALRNVA
jgi:peroxiredoxin